MLSSAGLLDRIQMPVSTSEQKTREEQANDEELGIAAKAHHSKVLADSAWLLSLNNNIEYDNTRCSFICCIEEFKASERMLYFYRNINLNKLQ